MSTHPVVTQDYEENLHGGVMVCGINFGFSQKDELQELKNTPKVPEPLSFFSDEAVNQTRFRARILKWLSGWGINLNRQKGEEGGIERSFFQTNWLDSQTRSVHSDENINIDMLVREADGFLQLLERRKPSVIFFFGRSLIEAMNDSRLRGRVTSILGVRSGNAQTYTAEAPDYRGRKWKMLVQSYGDTLVICLPHPQTRGLSDSYMAALPLPSQAAQRIRERARAVSLQAAPFLSAVDKSSGEILVGRDDPLFSAAKALDIDSEQAPVSLLQRKLRIGYNRAVRLYEALRQG